MVHEQSTECVQAAPAFWPSRNWTLSVGIILPLVTAAMVTNWADGAHPLHVAMEVTAMVAIGAVAVLAIRQGEHALGRVRHQVADLRATVARSREEIERSRAESQRWRAEAQQAVRGLAEAIDRQLVRWDLTPAEREVALLLLKGLSLKEIAQVRDTAERTARDQARAIYRKAGVAGRSELSAFFLEDLLLPAPAGPQHDPA